MSSALLAALRDRGVGWVQTPSPAAQARVLAESVAMSLREAQAARGQARLALSGGRSPIPFLKALACHVLEWEQVKLTLVDERWVAADQSESNERLLRRHLQPVFDRLQWQALYQGDSPAQDAALADNALAGWTPLDVVVLGMGLDGHTASLFPRQPQLNQWLEPGAGALCAATLAADGSPRLTLTGRALHSARRQLLAISGEQKLQVLIGALERDPLDCPIAAFLHAPLEIHYCPDQA
ncbi:6-phosphogluconolactonase [Halopseudomonas pachastrellae]|uniref:6-phosphogluconolactonase n=1 Tax=Halopseudomonas pachastrellae TaxID=254161 RepID=UPI003D7C3991